MPDATIYAIPFFLLFLVLEVVSYKLLPDEDQLGYDFKDARTSITMGLGSIATNLLWKTAMFAVYSAAYAWTPLRMHPEWVITWVLLLFADDFAFYWAHRASHEVRILWANHVVHHSSQYFNLSTAVRQPWTSVSGLPFWLPLALLGFAPWMIFLQLSINLVYQFGIHTERINKLPRPIECIFNTPSHHRVHHGSNQEYLDRNYGGIFIIWDRLFRTFEPEGERVIYGLTKNIDTHNPLRVALHEYGAIWRDVRTARRWRDRFGYALRGPGWSPAID